MTELERIDQLKERIKVLIDEWAGQRRRVTDKLYDLLEDLNLGPAPLLRNDKYTVTIDNHIRFPREADWEVREEIRFVNQDPKSKSPYDFGSSFSLYIYSNHIEINHGSCGQWGLDDKGQWSRLILMKAIFDHQDDIIRELGALLDFKVYEELWDLQCERDRIERDIENARIEREKQELLAQVKPGKWFAQLGWHWVYPEGKPSERVFHWYNCEKIVKITDKSFLTEDKYSSYRRNKDNYIYALKRKTLFIIDNPEDPVPEELLPKE